MRLSRLMGRTLRQPPADAQLPSHQLLARAGYIRGLEAGSFVYLPLGLHALRRLHALLDVELDALGGQEIALPGPPDGERMADLVRREVDSYRQLPLVLYQAAAETPAAGRARAGLFGAGQRPVVEVYAFEPAGPDAGAAVSGALDRVLAACDLQAVRAETGGRQWGLYVGHPAGDRPVVRCAACGYAAERSHASILWPEAVAGAEHEPEEVATPGCDTIAALAEFLDIPAAQTLKMVFYSVAGRVTCVVIRGDRSVDEDKLARLLGTERYYASTEDELAAIGAVGGYASPIGLRADLVRVVADPSIRFGHNWVTGANRPGYHLRGVNIPRDFEPGEWVDLVLVEPGDLCPRCGTAPVAIDGAFQIGAGQAAGQARGEYLDEAGRPQPLWVAGWRLDLAAVLAAVVEGHHDGQGIVWPAACAPFAVHIVGLDLRQEAVAAQAEALYARLTADCVSALYDDRDASPGVKFADADLIGAPLRLTVSKRSVAGGLVEAKWRFSPDRLNLDDAALAAALDRLPR